MGGNVIYRLTRTLEKDKNYKIYFDNYFSSVNLMVLLRQEHFWAICTVRQDGLQGSKKHLYTIKDLKKKKRGAVDYAVDANSGIIIVQWLDNNVMPNHLGARLVTQARRWSKKDKEYILIDRPQLVEEYNTHMGGVDLMDMLLSTYHIRQRSLKYYMHIFYYLVGVSVANAWLLYRRHMDQDKIPRKKHLTLMNFSTEIAESLCKAGKSEAPRARGRPSLENSVAATNGNSYHFLPV